MANKDRTQFLIECKNGEAANILYGLLHDKTLFLPELSLVNAHPKMFDSDFPLDFPHNMDIDSRYILNLDREEFAKELQQLFDADKIAYVELVVATDARNTRRIVVLTDPTRADKMSQITISLFDVPEKEARRIGPVPPIVINSSIWAIVESTAAEMQKDNRFLRRKEIRDTEFLEVSARIYNELLGFASEKFDILNIKEFV